MTEYEFPLSSGETNPKGVVEAGASTALESRVRVLIVEDHVVVRQGLRMVLGLDREIEVIGEAGTCADAIRLAFELKPDVVLMDIMLPDRTGIEATRAIKKANPNIEVLALTSILDRATVVDAVQAGAVGYLLKDIHATDLCRAVKGAAEGIAQLTPRAAQMLLKMVRTPTEVEPLTEREREVLILIARGQSNREIADELSLAEGTVKTHVRRILSKLGLQSRTQAALYAINAQA